MNEHTRRIASIGLIAALVLTACHVESAPRRVVAGTTFITTVTVPEGPLGFGAAPGTQGADQLLPTDPQRGNVSFRLCTDASCATSTALITRYLTLVQPHPASPAALRGDVTVDFLGAPTLSVAPFGGQALAALDVPAGTQARTYELTVFRSGGVLPAVSQSLGPIEVIASSVAQSSNITIEKTFSSNITAALRDLVPHPTVLLELVNRDPESSRPAAGSLVVRHPAQVTIKGAFEHGSVGQGSFVRFTDGADPDTVSVIFVDRDRRTYALALAFQLDDPSRPVSATDFVIESQRLYDDTGTQLAEAASRGAAGNRLAINPDNRFAFR